MFGSLNQPLTQLLIPFIGRNVGQVGTRCLDSLQNKAKKYPSESGEESERERPKTPLTHLIIKNSGRQEGIRVAVSEA